MLVQIGTQTRQFRTLFPQCRLQVTHQPFLILQLVLNGGALLTQVSYIDIVAIVGKEVYAVEVHVDVIDLLLLHVQCAHHVNDLLEIIGVFVVVAR